MLDILQALFLGIVQGITEWLPVSSSGHLAIAQHFMKLEVPVAFDVLLHLATLIVIVFFFRKDIWGILKAIWKRDFGSMEGRMFLFILVGSVPTAAIGFAFKGIFESMFISMAAIGGALLITGIILVLSGKGEGAKKLGYKMSLFMGIAQGIAVAPGISRSGATIGTALFAGLKREEAIRFSFLLAIPAISGAMLFQAGELALSGIGLDVLAAGFLASLIIGYLSLKLLISAVMSRKFSWFAAYCFALGIALVLLDI